MIIVPTSNSQKLCRSVGERLNATIADKTVKRFPDGEMYVRIKDDISDEAAVVIGNTRTDADLVEMLLTLNAAREGSASSVVAVVPYFGYSRQHKIYNPGEAISSKVMTEALFLYADRMYAVDLHDEETLEYSSKPFENIKIVKSIGDYFREYGLDYVVSPDDGGSQRARAISEDIGAESFFLNKVRIDSRTVKMEVPDVDINGKKVLLVDDIISTGGTIMRSAGIMKEKGASEVYISAVHGIFTNGSDMKIKEAADEVAVTDTIESGYSTISIAEEVAQKLKEVN